MKELHRCHPIFIVNSMARYLYLLLIPLARGFLSSLRGGFTAWLSGAWMDIIIVLLIVSIGVLIWWNLVFWFDKTGLTVKTGVFLRQRIFLPASRLSTLSVTRQYWLKPIGAVVLRVDTLAGGKRNADLTLILRRTDAQQIFGTLRQDRQAEGFTIREYVPRQLYVTALSAILSNSFAGVVFVATFISSLGQILGKEIQTRIVGTFEQVTKAFAFGIPPFAAALAYVILGGWLVAFLLNLFRHKNFYVRRSYNNLYIHGGIFTNRSYSLAMDSINYLDIRQSVLTKILRLHTAFIHCAGFGKDKSDVSAVIPAVTERELHRTLHLLLPEFTLSKREAKPNLGSIFKFIIDPFWPCLLLPLATLLLCNIFPSWSDLIGFIGLMASIPSYWWMILRIEDFASSGIGFDGSCYTFRYSTGFYLHTVVIPKNKIVSLRVRQSILQRPDDRCDVIIHTCAEGWQRHHCKNLLRSEVVALFGTTDPYCPHFVKTGFFGQFAFFRRSDRAR
ncbi:PH domain-containing protein [Zongyangia hominis]|uniref:PH domain-containing protein n=1 Tax=Zongyangia hominis TaxID=2763677 RepID=A0A926IAX6_9FIRM|nr:PH domain-containing protein [Zongyangia hominis]MBC8570661.1 PH domain-containing protein [Zongyangia hominis]